MTRRQSARQRAASASLAALSLTDADAIATLALPRVRSGGLAASRYRVHRWEQMGGLDEGTGEALPEPLLADPPEPIVLPRPPDGDVEAEAAFRAAKVLAMRRRHELRRKLWREGDAHRTIDLPDAIHRLAVEMVAIPPVPNRRHEVPYSKILSGISQARLKSGRLVDRWRAYPWLVDTSTPYGKRGQKGKQRRKHLGYFPTRAQAIAAVIRFRREQGDAIDVSAPEWMTELMALAVRQKVPTGLTLD
jgi:hypothetical protein